MKSQELRPQVVANEPPDIRDRDLIARVLAGERELFHELVRPYEKSVYFAAFSVLQNEHDAEEAAQETVLKALKNLHTFRAEAKFSTWLVSIALNEARGRLRHARLIEFDSIDATPDDDTGEFVPAVISDWREVPLEGTRAQRTARVAARRHSALAGKVSRSPGIARRAGLQHCGSCCRALRQ